MSRPITALLPYFGSARTVAAHVGRQLAGCRCVVIPFAGGMSEVLHLPGAKTVLVSDLNRHAINLANVLADRHTGPALVRRLRRLPFHEDTLRIAQAVCARAESDGDISPGTWAEAYFVASWMGRNGAAGTDREFCGGLSFRTDGDGGDSAGRFRSATEALLAWRRVMPRCTFLVRDCFEVLAKVRDRPTTGVYCDPPWPQDGDKYRHKFAEADQRKLAEALAGFASARVVVRYGDHPLVRELYPEGRPWRYLAVAGRTANRREAGSKAEVLIVNGELKEDPQ